MKPMHMHYYKISKHQIMKHFWSLGLRNEVFTRATSHMTQNNQKGAKSFHWPTSEIIFAVTIVLGRSDRLLNVEREQASLKGMGFLCWPLFLFLCQLSQWLLLFKNQRIVLNWFVLHGIIIKLACLLHLSLVVSLQFVSSLDPLKVNHWVGTNSLLAGSIWVSTTLEAHLTLNHTITILPVHFSVTFWGAQESATNWKIVNWSWFLHLNKRQERKLKLVKRWGRNPIQRW